MDSTSWSANNHWSTFWGQLTIELIGGVFGAIVFLFIVLIFFRPKIEIASFICKYNSLYFFKFVNKSFFDAHEIKIELHEIVTIPKGNGDFNTTLKKLTLLNSEILHLPKRPFWNSNKLYPHCITVRTKEDISLILSNENCAVLIRISLKHGLTGISAIFENDYATKQSIKPGEYKPGPKFVVHK